MFIANINTLVIQSLIKYFTKILKLDTFETFMNNFFPVKTKLIIEYDCRCFTKNTF